MKNNCLQIRVHGRGGQGVVTAAELIALAAFYDHKESQAFPFFGVERSGAPIMAFARISKDAIKTRERVYYPDFLIIQDATLLDEDDILNGSHSDTKILVNSAEDVQAIWNKLKEACKRNKQKLVIKPANIFSCHATEIAMEIIGKNIVNTVILGALAKNSDLFSITALKKAVTEKFASKGKSILDKNIAAILKIYESN
jgi:pyruvate ferredoxin oxidoreductase gamma subunit